MKVTVLYSCHCCGIRRQEVDVPARGEEDVLVWMKTMGEHLSRDHHMRSPHCRPETLSDVMIPIAGTSKVGGPAEN